MPLNTEAGNTRVFLNINLELVNSHGVQLTFTFLRFSIYANDKHHIAI